VKTKDPSIRKIRIDEDTTVLASRGDYSKNKKFRYWGRSKGYEVWVSRERYAEMHERDAEARAKGYRKKLDAYRRQYVERADSPYIWVPHLSDQKIATHSKKRCNGTHCPVHNISDHHMRDWPQRYRFDRNITERICPCGVGHPDPDDPTTDKIHGCCGCCTPPKKSRRKK